jgi:hypothetical protein
LHDTFRCVHLRVCVPLVCVPSGARAQCAQASHLLYRKRCGIAISTARTNYVKRRPAPGDSPTHHLTHQYPSRTGGQETKAKGTIHLGRIQTSPSGYGRQRTTTTTTTTTTKSLQNNNHKQGHNRRSGTSEVYADASEVETAHFTHPRNYTHARKYNSMRGRPRTLVYQAHRR